MATKSKTTSRKKPRILGLPKRMKRSGVTLTKTACAKTRKSLASEIAKAKKQGRKYATKTDKSTGRVCLFTSAANKAKK